MYLVIFLTFLLRAIDIAASNFRGPRYLILLLAISNIDHYQYICVLFKLHPVAPPDHRCVTHRRRAKVAYKKEKKKIIIFGYTF
jgi:hypothetical protein